MLKQLVLKNRSYRRFYQDYFIDKKIIKELIELARFCPSAANLQSIRHMISNEPARNQSIFECLAWAGYLKNWKGPEEGEKPSAYIVVLGDKTVRPVIDIGYDCGIVCQTILLGAVEKNLGGCIVANIDREKLSKRLKLDVKYEILVVISLGKPVENIHLEEVKPDGDVKYWRDNNDEHHVPKRTLEELILENG